MCYDTHPFLGFEKKLCFPLDNVDPFSQGKSQNQVYLCLLRGFDRYTLYCAREYIGFLVPPLIGQPPIVPTVGRQVPGEHLFVSTQVGIHLLLALIVPTKYKQLNVHLPKSSSSTTVVPKVESLSFSYTRQTPGNGAWGTLRDSRFRDLFVFFCWYRSGHVDPTTLSP